MEDKTTTPKTGEATAGKVQDCTISEEQSYCTTSEV